MKVSHKKNSSEQEPTSSKRSALVREKRDLSAKQDNANGPRGKRTSPRRSEARTKVAAPRAYVEHHYHDHARDPIAQPVSIVGPRSDSVMTRSFPEKLHHLLASMDEEGLEHIIAWQPHGRCFVIHEKKTFVEDIMPRFFMQTKLTSFQRQLNLYGFVRLTAGVDRGGYYHEYFLRGRPDLCRFMVRTRVKGIGMKAASSPSTEPAFYSYESCPAEGPPKSTTNNAEDDNKSVNSEMTDLRTNGLPLIKSSANLVSPPESPVLSSTSTVKLPDDFDLPCTCSLDIFSNPEEPCPHHTGDEVFFEGLKFIYLDHLDLDDVANDITVTNVEYV